MNLYICDICDTYFTNLLIVPSHALKSSNSPTGDTEILGESEITRYSYFCIRMPISQFNANIILFEYTAFVVSLFQPVI